MAELTAEIMIEELKWALHISMWNRMKSHSREVMKVLDSYSPAVFTSEQYLWHAKAKALLYQMLLPENSEIWRHERKALPYERNTKEYHNWRIDCLNRDNWQCQTCQTTTKLNVHHVKPYKSYKEMRLNINNGITLCEICHKQEHKKR